MADCGCESCTHFPEEQRRRELENPQASFWRHRFRLPGTQWTLSGHSRALERTGFLLEEPRIYLDAGIGRREAIDRGTNAILVTHTHIDHIGALPLLFRVNSNIDTAIVVPREHLNNCREFGRMSFGIKGEDGSVRAGQRQDVELKPTPPTWGPIVDVKEAGSRDPVPEGSGLRGRLWVPASPGVRLQLPGTQKVVCECVRCFHTLVDAGFVLSETKPTTFGIDADAQAEYEELLERCKVDKKAGREIGAMMKAGKPRRGTVTIPRVAYLCDTTTQVFGTQCPSCASGGEASECAFSSPYGNACETDPTVRETQRRLLLSCSCIVVECSFIGAGGMTDEDADKEAIKRGHASWRQLQTHVEANPNITFILVHFSLRYKEQDIRKYFRTASSEGARPANVVLWLDSGIDTADGNIEPAP